MKKFKFGFEDKVYHKTLGFRGYITGRVEYSDGYKKYGVRLTGNSKRARRQDYRWITEGLLILDKEK